MSTSTDCKCRSILVFLLSMAVLSLQVALTRVFSFIMYHHFTYLVISVAMLGFGAAGTYLTIRDKSGDSSGGNQFLARMAALFGLTTIVAIVFIPRIHFYPLDVYFYNDYSNLLSMLVIIILTATPFFFGGACIAYIIIARLKGSTGCTSRTLPARRSGVCSCWY